MLGSVVQVHPLLPYSSPWQHLLPGAFFAVLVWNISDNHTVIPATLWLSNESALVVIASEFQQFYV
jgi:hypothetical protein